MTTSPPAPARRRAPLGLVGTTATAHIGRLQYGYRNDRPDAVAALARIRRGAGKPAGEMPDLWGLTGTEQLYAAGWSEARTTQAEDAVHSAVTLWALHQQSHRAADMHAAQGPELGTAVRRLMPGAELDEPTRKRFVRAGTASSLIVLAQRLRDIVLLLRRDAIPLDYGLLADQLYRWQQPGGAEQVRRSWGRAFHAYRAPATGNPDDATAAGTDMPDSDTTTTQKDAP